MLRVAEYARLTDTGRQRRMNEDAFFARAPLFAVADGMGGAQAGEVASRTAVEVVERGLPAGAGSVEERLLLIARDANARIHSLSVADQARAGMGTTLTAAYVGEHDVTVVHVGDSRCYLRRGDDVMRVTTDHSLVEELVRQGRLTPEEAEEHPQRSIITRALGPEAQVEADSHTIPARDGDLFLLCSDGLTSMLPEGEVAELLCRPAPLAALAQELVDRANAAGGRDNITVILFRLEALVAGGDGALRDDDATQVGDAALRVEDVERALAETPSPSTAPRAAAAMTREPRAPQVARGTGIPTPRRRRRVRPAWVFGLVFGLIVLAGGYLASQAVYFVGTGNDGFVTIYRGMPVDLPAGLDLYQPLYVSGVSDQQLSAPQARTIREHRLRSRADADDLVRQLETGKLGGP